MPTYSTPGVYFETVDTGRRGISAIRTDIAAFIGIAEKGPLHKPVQVRAWEQFRSTFGGFLPNGYLAYVVKAFFENGGRSCYVVRVAAEQANTRTQPGITQPDNRTLSIVKTVEGFAPGAVVSVRQSPTTHTSVAIQPADRKSSIVERVSGFPVGTLVEISQQTPAPRRIYRKVKEVDTDAKKLVWDKPLDFLFDLTQPIQFKTQHHVDHLLKDVIQENRWLIWERPVETWFALDDSEHPPQFETGASRAWCELVDEEGEPTLRIEARTEGAWGNGLSVQVRRSIGIATRTARISQPSDRSSSLVENVVGFSTGSLVRIFQGRVSGPVVEVYRIVMDVDQIAKRLTWDTPLGAGFDLTRPMSLETLTFTLTVHYEGKVREIFNNLSLVTNHPMYVEHAISEERSATIRVEVLDSPSPLPTRLPDPQAGNLVAGRARLCLGRDGIAALKSRHFIGEKDAETKRGLRTLEEVDEVAIVAMPDILIQPVPPTRKAPLPPPEVDICLPDTELLPVGEPLAPRLIEKAPRFSLDQIFIMQQALVTHCEEQRDRIALIDAPRFSGRKEQVELEGIQAWRWRFDKIGPFVDTKYAALYFPWVLVYDPLQFGGEVVRAIPPSGHVAGVYARLDNTIGVHKAPANAVLRWAQGITVGIEADTQGLLNPVGINCVRNFPGRGLRLYGARTMSRDPSWRFVNVRRLLMMIEEAIEESIQWTVFEPNDFYLRQTLTLAINSFLEALWKRGALVGAKAGEAFFVKCDEENNPPYVTEKGRLIVEVGVAPTRPAEFIIFRIGRTEEELEITELGGGNRWP